MSAPESTDSPIESEKPPNVFQDDNTPPQDEPMKMRQQFVKPQPKAREDINSGTKPLFSPNHINNNHHIVPVGVLIVLFTLYLTTAALQRTYGFSTNPENSEPENNLANDAENSDDKELIGEEIQNANVMNRFREDANNVCFDFEIFTKEIEWPQKFEVISATESKITKLVNRKKPTQQKLSNGKNGHKYNNKSSKTKLNQNKNEANKKDKDQQSKKNSTAEPIIYLFALVFIYLLLKAASDINQHYKSKSKGDKRLRRCSLQSYAQTHKQDRRASKDALTKLRQRQRLLKSRCKSVDRCTTPIIEEENIFKKTDILTKLKQYTSVDESKIVTGSLSFEHLKSSTSKPEEFSKLLTPTSVTNRRCSVPSNALTYRWPPSLTAGAAIVPNTARRTSITGGSITASGLSLGMCSGGSSFDGGDPLFPEVKRRVRMINRH